MISFTHYLNIALLFLSLFFKNLFLRRKLSLTTNGEQREALKEERDVVGTTLASPSLSEPGGVSTRARGLDPIARTAAARVTSQRDPRGREGLVGDGEAPRRRPRRGPPAGRRRATALDTSGSPLCA